MKLNKELKKYCEIFCVLLFIIILVCIFKYIYKFTIVVSYQDTISQLDNYLMEINQTKLYVKNDTYIWYPMDTQCIYIDKKNSKQYIIMSGSVQDISNEENFIIPDICSMFKITNSNSIWNIMKADMWLKLSNDTYKNTKCYKLKTNSEKTRFDYTIYFDANTKLPIAYANQTDTLTDVKISIGVVQDKDVSFEEIVNKVKKADF